MLELVGPPAGHSLSDDSDARQYNCLDMQLWRAVQCATDVADDKPCAFGKMTVMREAKRRKWR
jgi:hypothetical protein